MHFDIDSYEPNPYEKTNLPALLASLMDNLLIESKTMNFFNWLIAF